MASLLENDLMLQVDFEESYKNDQQDVIQSAYLGNEYFRILKACCYAKSSNNNVRNDNAIVVTESSNHDRYVCELPA